MHAWSLRSQNLLLTDAFCVSHTFPPIFLFPLRPFPHSLRHTHTTRKCRCFSTLIYRRVLLKAAKKESKFVLTSAGTFTDISIHLIHLHVHFVTVNILTLKYFAGARAKNPEKDSRKLRLLAIYFCVLRNLRLNHIAIGALPHSAWSLTFSVTREAKEKEKHKSQNSKYRYD